VSYDEQRRLYEQLRADQALVEQAAKELRHQAILAAYAGMGHKELPFAMALMLDELARHLRDLDDELRAQVLTGARMLIRRCAGGVTHAQ
jgi:hypothetical protein